MNELTLEEQIRKERNRYCAENCPNRHDSEAGMPSCGPCPWEDDEDDENEGWDED